MGGGKRPLCAGFGWATVFSSAHGGAEVQASKGHLVDALAPRGEEGRGTLRKALGSREQALIQGYPNGATPAARQIRS